MDNFLAVDTKIIGIGAQKTADINIAGQVFKTARFNRLQINYPDPQICRDCFEIIAKIFAHLAQISPSSAASNSSVWVSIVAFMIKRSPTHNGPDNGLEFAFAIEILTLATNSNSRLSRPYRCTREKIAKKSIGYQLQTVFETTL